MVWKQNIKQEMLPNDFLNTFIELVCYYNSLYAERIDKNWDLKPWTSSSFLCSSMKRQVGEQGLNFDHRSELGADISKKQRNLRV